ncbi:exodeoxyribonuclease VII small subunit [Campylobacter jejuni]|uniref:exodeoxyribonuclease VII small subunit n=1 Tax=Campylobacter jejuni TaxID=197 RepID=UPI002741A4A2|nr:exodeoxyribonuclease VII small subunit [Campylobacter jejuni]
MSFEENLKHANESLEKLNNQELALDESVKIYKEGLESIKKARLELEKAKLEVGQIDE